MKNLFLYQNVNNRRDLPPRKGLYEFKDSDLVGIDVNIVDKTDRKGIISDFRLREFFVIQPWFRLLISHASKLGILVTKIKLKNELDEDEFIDLERFIRSKDYQGLIKFLKNINYDGDFDIESVSFNFSGYPFTITSEGVLETFIDDELFVNALTHPEVWNVISGSIKND